MLMLQIRMGLLMLDQFRDRSSAKIRKQKTKHMQAGLDILL